MSLLRKAISLGALADNRISDLDRSLSLMDKVEKANNFVCNLKDCCDMFSSLLGVRDEAKADTKDDTDTENA